MTRIDFRCKSNNSISVTTPLLGSSAHRDRQGSGDLNSSWPVHTYFVAMAWWVDWIAARDASQPALEIVLVLLQCDTNQLASCSDAGLGEKLL